MKNLIGRGTPRAFTMIELAMVIVAVLAIVALVLVMLPRKQVTHGQTSESTYVRGLHQGLVMASQGGQDSYVLPSLMDKGNMTVAAEGRSKDTTANIFSILIYNGFFGPELCVSTQEANPAIRQATNYSYATPSTAVNPVQALWDPSFSADFTNGKVSNFSYAHMMPVGPRKAQWANSFSATEAMVGNRGPQIASVTRTAEAPAATVASLVNPRSNTLLIHGPRESWEGLVAYNDNHVEYESAVVSPNLTYKAKEQRLSFSDCLFYDEPDDDDGLNAFLGVFTTSGESPADWTSIWD